MGKFIIALLSIMLTSAYATPAQVIIIRHGEKPNSGNTLDQRGYERADALAGFFQYSSSLKPDAIYAQATDASHGSLRSIETCMPTAQALEIPLNSQYGHDDYANMAQSIMNAPSLQGKTVLICSSHEVIPALAASFGVSPKPTAWPGKVFDQMYVIEFNQTSGAVNAFTILPQQLLYGDSKKTVL